MCGWDDKMLIKNIKWTQKRVLKNDCKIYRLLGIFTLLYRQ